MQDSLCIVILLSFDNCSNIVVIRDRDYRQGGRGSDYSGRMMQRERSFSGPVNTISDRSSFDQKSTNGLQAVSRQTPSMSISVFRRYHISVSFSFLFSI